MQRKIKTLYNELNILNVSRVLTDGVEDASIAIYEDVEALA